MKNNSEMTPAAVLLPLFHDSENAKIEYTNTKKFRIIGDAEILLTVRTDTVEHHKGQISFPGGRKDEEDTDFLHTALRETEEELGLPREQIRIIAELPMIPIPRTGFQVRPFVGIVEKTAAKLLKPSPIEIAQLLFVPLSHLLDPKNSTLETYEHEGVLYQLKAYHYKEHRIWGATAKMLQFFLESQEPAK